MKEKVTSIISIVSGWGWVLGVFTNISLDRLDNFLFFLAIVIPVISMSLYVKWTQFGNIFKMERLSELKKIEFENQLLKKQIEQKELKRKLEEKNLL